MTMLKEEQLENVNGGLSNEGQLCVRVDYSNDKKQSTDVMIKPYLNGELLKNKIRTVDRSVSVVNLIINGKGIADLKVKINNEIIKLYELDFDKGSYIEL